MSISNKAVEAAAEALREAFDMGVGGFDEQARAALEAALPILLSHEREETRLAHVDAVVNRDMVDRLEAQIERVRELHISSGGHNPECHCGVPAGTGANCTECGDVWPCPTILALAE